MVEVRPPIIGRRSSIFTRTPADASRIAEASPPGPAPMMIASLVMVWMLRLFIESCRQRHGVGLFQHPAQLRKGQVLQLPDSFAGEIEFPAHFLQRALAAAIQ